MATTASAEAVLDSARAALEAAGYRWRRERAADAEAHEGGELIEKRSSGRLLLRLQVREGRLVLEQATTGSSGYAYGPLGAAIQLRLRSRFKKARKLVTRRLGRDGLLPGSR